MARRTTAAAVQEILGADWDGKRSVVPFIDSVTNTVSRVVQYGAGKGVSLSAAEAEVLERWLAAWAYVMSDRTLDSKNTGKAGGTFSGKTDKGLDANMYGQMAGSLDPTGTLRAIIKGQILQTTWLGKPPSEQIDYDHRN
jgi:hypothetical protein